MTKKGPQKQRHFVFKNTAKSESYVYAGGGVGGTKETPRRERKTHGVALLEQFHKVEEEIEVACEAQRNEGMKEGLGLQIEFESFPDIELAFESLADERYGIELLNVYHEKEVTHATNRKTKS